jgi:hypothetical protein
MEEHGHMEGYFPEPPHKIQKVPGVDSEAHIALIHPESRIPAFVFKLLRYHNLGQACLHRWNSSPVIRLALHPFMICLEARERTCGTLCTVLNKLFIADRAEKLEF